MLRRPKEDCKLIDKSILKLLERRRGISREKGKNFPDKVKLKKGEVSQNVLC